MSFNISEFSANISRLSPARLNRYAVQITPPAELNHPIVSDMIFLCNTTNLPGANIGVDIIKHRGYGLDEKRPNSISFDDITLTVIADGRGMVLDFFQKWINLVFSHDEENGVATELFNYPDEYWGTMDIYLYDITSATYTTYTMNKLFPTGLGAIQMGWDQNDQLMQIPVSFAFRNYKRNSNYTGFTNSPANQYMNISTNEYQQRMNL